MEYVRMSERAHGDSEPLLRLARMLRDDARRYDDAALWMRRVLRTALAPALDAQVGRELAELLLYRSDEPRRAAPELARLAHQHRCTPIGEWAAAELTVLKERIRAAELAE